VSIAATVGAAAWDPGETAAEIVHRPDFAMYQEKIRNVIS
jgi:hypothetical protein